MSDSGDDLGVVIDSATVTHAFINKLHMDGRSVSKVRPFFITDSAGMSGQIFFGHTSWILPSGLRNRGKI